MPSPSLCTDAKNPDAVTLIAATPEPDAFRFECPSEMVPRRLEPGLIAGLTLGLLSTPRNDFARLIVLLGLNPIPFSFVRLLL